LNDVHKPFSRFHAMIIDLMIKILIPFSEFHFTFSRSSGAGGQNINKVNSKAVLEWNIFESPSLSDGIKERFKEKYKNHINESGIVQITAQEHRSQKDNIDECISKLHQMIQKVIYPPKVRKPTKPKRSAVLKRLSSKKKDSEKKRLRKTDY
jgi:ribosome-associated protein